MVAAGLEHRVNLVCGDAFLENPHEAYDLVCWHSSLHHMPDAYAAVQWSREALKPGGVFAMWEYTGPTRWQWSDRNLQNVNAFRRALPPKFRPENLVIKRPSLKQMMERDPSEASDSANIRPAVEVAFSNAEMIDLGGALYSFGLRGIWPKIRPGDEWLLDIALAFDQAMVDDNLVTCAFARKD
jgi:SAM-dependent methyltransferase